MPADTPDRRGRLAYNLGGLAMLALLIGAAVCWRERILFTDPSFILFRMLLEGQPIISEHRYGAVVTQVFPLIGFRLGLPLAMVCWFYSVSFYVFHTAIYLVLGLRWRQYGLALLLPLYLTLIVSDVYFWPNNEIHQAVGWGLLFVGCYLHLRPRPLGVWQHVVLLVLLLITTNTHPLVAAPLTFVWVTFVWARSGGWRGLLPRDGLYTLAIGLGIGLRYYLSHESWYDGYKLQGVRALDWSAVTASFQSGQLRTMLGYAELYWPLAVVALVGCYAAIRSRAYGVLLLTMLAGVVYTVLVCVTYPGGFGRVQLYYFESEWMGLGLILAVPFILYGLPKLPRYVMVAVLLISFGARTRVLADSYAYYHQRVNNLGIVTETLREAGMPKVISYPATDWQAYFGITWGLPLETLWASALADPAAISLKVVDTEGEVATAVTDFRSNFKRLRISEMPTEYFGVDTTGGYRLLTTEESETLRELLQPLPD
ncbi:hypothetical protein [Neolewinella sp.]|uniref:hypothetical protein n=1 Tax=Neolewinella sp. TaxID=2993543 RepID=UPI003B523B69